MACVWYLLNPKAGIITPKFSCGFEGNNGTGTTKRHG
jgi:hypothetical protein